MGDVINIMNWRQSAANGNHTVYFTGNLAMTRQKVGDDAWNLYMKGRALLTQRKIAFGKYEYIITACDAKPVVEKI